MRTENVLISLVALLLGLLLLIFGVLFVSSAYFSIFEATMVSYFSAHLFKIGVISLLFAFVLLGAFCALSRRRYLLVKMGGFSIQDRVLGELAQKSLESLFSTGEVSCDVLVRGKKRVEVIANLPFTEEEEQVLEEVESVLQEAFAQSCGIKHEFLLNVSFRDQISKG